MALETMVLLAVGVEGGMVAAHGLRVEAAARGEPPDTGAGFVSMDFMLRGCWRDPQEKQPRVRIAGGR